MRARFTDRIRELGRTYQETAAAIERASTRADDLRRTRLAELTVELAGIDALRARATDLATHPG